MRTKQDTSLLDWQVARPALRAALAKFDPRVMAKNPVIFVTEIVAVLSTLIFLRDLVVGGENLAVTGQIAAWLWFTVYFANFAEAIAEGRGKARADSLRATQTDTPAKKLAAVDAASPDVVSSRSLRPGDLVLVETGDIVPADGEIVEGIASVDESAITGESAPVVRESGGDRSAVTGGTRVLSDRIVVEITQDPGQSFLDKMIALPYRHYLPAHGGPVSDGPARAAALKAHRQMRNEQVLDAVRNGARRLGQVVDAIYPTQPARVRLAARMTMAAHVEYLEAQGLLSVKRGLFGTRLYRSA